MIFWEDEVQGRDSNTWWVSPSISCFLLRESVCSPPCPSLLTGVITEFYPEQKKKPIITEADTSVHSVRLLIWRKSYPESKRKEETGKDKEVAETPMVRTSSFLFYLTANPWNINLNVKDKTNVQIHKRSCSSLRHIWSTQPEKHTVLMSHFNACFLIILSVGWILDIWWIRE